MMGIMGDLLKEENQFNVLIAISIGVLLLVVIMDPLGMITKKEETRAEEKKKVVDPKTKYTRDEVAKHCTETDAWIIVDNNVYDITDYVDSHPGGEAILKNVGGDSTKGVHGPQHPASMWDVLATYKIGELSS